jgi:TM2 domain-containing membrane protein YozV
MRSRPATLGVILGSFTAAIWGGILVTGVLEMIGGHAGNGFGLVVAAGWTILSMLWGAVIVWALKREPMRKVITEIRDGMDRRLTRLEEQDPPAQGHAPLAVVRPFRSR